MLNQLINKEYYLMKYVISPNYSQLFELGEYCKINPGILCIFFVNFASKMCTYISFILLEWHVLYYYKIKYTA